MLFKKHNIHITSVDYAIDYDSKKKLATITPNVHATCTKSKILIASIDIDNHELLPSLKLVLEKGKRPYILPCVKIVSPLLSAPDDEDKKYKMTLKLHFGNDETYDLEEYIKIIS
jgi:hypothetical protein